MCGEYVDMVDYNAHHVNLVTTKVYGDYNQGVQGWAKEWTLGCVNPASRLPLTGGRFHAT